MEFNNQVYGCVFFNINKDMVSSSHWKSIGIALIIFIIRYLKENGYTGKNAQEFIWISPLKRSLFDCNGSKSQIIKADFITMNLIDRTNNTMNIRNATRKVPPSKISAICQSKGHNFLKAPPYGCKAVTNREYFICLIELRWAWAVYSNAPRINPHTKSKSKSVSKNQPVNRARHKSTAVSASTYLPRVCMHAGSSVSIYLKRTQI